MFKKGGGAMELTVAVNSSQITFKIFFPSFKLSGLNLNNFMICYFSNKIEWGGGQGDSVTSLIDVK